MFQNLNMPPQVCESDNFEGIQDNKYWAGWQSLQIIQLEPAEAEEWVMSGTKKIWFCESANLIERIPLRFEKL